MQAKDVPERPILALLDAQTKDRYTWTFWWDWDDRRGLRSVMPGVPDRVQQAKLRKLIKRGLVDGCVCGCRGDFTITKKGRAHLAQLREVGEKPARGAAIEQCGRVAKVPYRKGKPDKRRRERDG